MPKLSSVIEQVSGAFKMVKGKDVDFDVVNGTLDNTQLHINDKILIDDDSVDTASPNQNASIFTTTVGNLKDFINTNITGNSSITTLGTITNGTWNATPITHDYIGDDAIDGDNIQDNAIDSEHYTDGSIDHEHLAADAVDGDNIADNSIDSEHYVDGSIDTAHIADDQVTLAKMAGLTRGSIIIGDASGNPAALALGSNNYVLTSDGTDISWEAAAAGVTVSDSTANTNFPVVFHDESNNLHDDTGAFHYNPSTGKVTATQFSGAFAGALTGNADTVTTNANLTGHITSTGNATSLGSFTLAQLNTAISDGSVGDVNVVTGVSNGADNRVATFTSASALNGEQDFTWDGTELLLSSSTASKPRLTIRNISNDTNDGCEINLTKMRADDGVEQGQNLGEIWFRGQNSNQIGDTSYAFIIGEIDVGTNNEESGSLALGVATHDGDTQTGLRLTGGSVNDEIDVVIGLGAHSVTTIKGDVIVQGDSLTLNSEDILPMKDEDDMSSDSANHVPTQQSVKAYVATQVSGLGTGATELNDLTDVHADVTSSSLNKNDVMKWNGSIFKAVPYDYSFEWSYSNFNFNFGLNAWDISSTTPNMVTRSGTANNPHDFYTNKYVEMGPSDGNATNSLTVTLTMPNVVAGADHSSAPNVGFYSGFPDAGADTQQGLQVKEQNNTAVDLGEFTLTNENAAKTTTHQFNYPTVDNNGHWNPTTQVYARFKNDGIHYEHKLTISFYNKMYLGIHDDLGTTLPNSADLQTSSGDNSFGAYTVASGNASTTSDTSNKTVTLTSTARYFQFWYPERITSTPTFSVGVNSSSLSPDTWILITDGDGITGSGTASVAVTRNGFTENYKGYRSQQPISNASGNSFVIKANFD